MTEYVTVGFGTRIWRVIAHDGDYLELECGRDHIRIHQSVTHPC